MKNISKIRIIILAIAIAIWCVGYILPPTIAVMCGIVSMLAIIYILITICYENLIVEEEE